MKKKNTKKIKMLTPKDLKTQSGGKPTLCYSETVAKADPEGHEKEHKKA